MAINPKFNMNQFRQPASNLPREVGVKGRALNNPTVSGNMRTNNNGLPDGLTEEDIEKIVKAGDILSDEAHFGKNHQEGETLTTNVKTSKGIVTVIITIKEKHDSYTYTVPSYSY